MLLESMRLQFLQSTHLQLLTFYVSLIVLARRKISPISREKVWLSLSWWNISLWRVKPHFYWANNRIGYACQHLTVQAMEKQTVEKHNTEISVCLHRAPLLWIEDQHKGQKPALCFLFSAAKKMKMCPLLKISWELTFDPRESGSISIIPVLNFEHVVSIHKYRHLVSLTAELDDLELLSMFAEYYSIALMGE